MRGTWGPAPAAPGGARGLPLAVCGPYSRPFSEAGRLEQHAQLLGGGARSQARGAGVSAEGTTVGGRVCVQQSLEGETPPPRSPGPGSAQRVLDTLTHLLLTTKLQS